MPTKNTIFICIYASPYLDIVHTCTDTHTHTSEQRSQAIVKSYIWVPVKQRALKHYIIASVGQYSHNLSSQTQNQLFNMLVQPSSSQNLLLIYIYNTGLINTVQLQLVRNSLPKFPVILNDSSKSTYKFRYCMQIRYFCPQDPHILK